MWWRAVVGRRRGGALFLPVCLALVMLGCSGKGTVRGKVTLGGTKPVASGIVIFIGADDLPFSGPINARGEYEVANVTPGQKQVTVVNAMVGPGSPALPDPVVRPTVPKVLPIPSKYARRNNGLQYTVQPGVQTFDINLAP